MSKAIPTKKEGKEFYDQADVIPAKWLMPDGSIVDELPIEGAGSEVDLEDNHQTTINVSEYTEPVEITPTAGKDGMKKNTITLLNIPSGVTSVSCNYLWGDNDGHFLITDFETVPDTFVGHWIGSGEYTSAYEEVHSVSVNQITSDDAYNKVDDNSFEYNDIVYELMTL